MELSENDLKIINSSVKKLHILLKKKLSERILHETMIVIIENTPLYLHNDIMLKFTYILGEYYKLEFNEVNKILFEEKIDNLFR